MKLIIEIPEEKVKTIKSDLYNTFHAEMKEWGLEAIINGTSCETVNPQEPKTGRWIVISPAYMYCSNCNEIEHLDTSRRFCAWCGTRMVGPQESEET